MANPPTLTPLPFQEAIDAFAAKGLRLDPSFAWQDRMHGDHAAQFTVAKSTGFDILGDVHGAMLDAMQNGTTYEDFVRTLQPTLEAKGWWGRKEMVDPLTGETKMVQLGSPRRLRIIFDTNIRMAAAAGRWSQIERTADTRPYLRYIAVLDSRTRDDHRRWHGIVLRWDDPWWDVHYPPNGWRCRCTVQTLSERDLERWGYKVSTPPPDKMVTWKNPRTDDDPVEIPEGIDPGFAYHPGRTAIEVHRAQMHADKWVSAPPALTAAAQAASIRFLAPLLSRGISEWVQEIDAKVRVVEAAAQQGQKLPLILRGERKVVGALSPQVLADLVGRGVVPQSGAITITDGIAAHMVRTAKVARGAALPAADLMRLPDILAAPAAVLWDTTDPALLYVYDPGGGVRGKLVVRIDIHERVARVKLVTNAIRSGGIVLPVDLLELRQDGTRRYDPVK